MCLIPGFLQNAINYYYFYDSGCRGILTISRIRGRGRRRRSLGRKIEDPAGEQEVSDEGGNGWWWGDGLSRGAYRTS